MVSHSLKKEEVLWRLIIFNAKFDYVSFERQFDAFSCILLHRGEKLKQSYFLKKIIHKSFWQRLQACSKKDFYKKYDYTVLFQTSA